LPQAKHIVAASISVDRSVDILLVLLHLGID